MNALLLVLIFHVPGSPPNALELTPAGTFATVEACAQRAKAITHLALADRSKFYVGAMCVGTEPAVQQRRYQ
jgi:hypothetical protein